MRHDNDIIVIGGGPAGISAAIWASELNLTCVLVERSGSLGGRLSYVFNPIRNYPAREAESGKEMRKHFLESLENADFELLAGREVTDLDVSKRLVHLNDGTSVHGRAIIIATGVRRRTLNVPGEDDFAEKGILASGAKEPGEVAGKNVVIVGGGDAAIENALILSEHADRVTIIHRRESFKARSEFLETARSTSNIEFLTNKEIVSFSGAARLATVDVRDRNSGRIDSLKTEAALIRIGSQPNSELFHGKIETDVNGYIRVSPACETSAPNIYAIGDVANPFSQNLSTASGNAATAIAHISKSRTASD